MIPVFVIWLTAFSAPAGASRSLEGTLVSIEDARPVKITVHADSQFQVFPLARRAAVERESRLPGDAAPRTAPIDPSDLTPGEFVRLEIDAHGTVTRARAVALLERASVRSAQGARVVLEDGTTLTIGSVLRFVGADGKPSATAALRSGESVVLFRHPETRNIYRFGVDSLPRPPSPAPRPSPR